MNIAITGATGLVGTALQTLIKEAGHTVYTFTRTKNKAEQHIYWNPVSQEIEKDKLQNIDVIINLAGHNVSSGRWNAKTKQAIYDSRIQGTRLLVDTIKQMDTPPQLLLNASAIGYYGSQGETILDESAPNGSGFLAKVCHDWEDEAQKAQSDTTRVVNLRIGLILAAQGGALPKMLTPYKLGLGGTLGDPNAYLSWITLQDLTQAILHCINTPAISGPVNGTAPNPTTNQQLTKTLGKLLRRPPLFPMPTPLVKLIFGEMGQELLLPSIYAIPLKLTQNGFTFQHTSLDEALKAQLT